VIALILVISMGVTGCGKKQEVAEPAPAASEPQQGGILVGETDNSLLGWLKRKQGVECVVEDKEGRVVIQSKQDKVRMTGIPYVDMASAVESGGSPDMNGVSLTVGDWIYMWSERDKKGTKMNIKKIESLAADDEEIKDQETWDEAVADWEDEEVEYNCTDKNLSDDLFTPPGDVEFTDLTDFMLGIGEMADEMEKQFEAGGEIDLEALEQQAKDLQEKYGIEE
jgi:hypothetical protein